MKTAQYLNTLISLILQQPKISTILDEDGIEPEITYGRIGIKDYDAFINLYSLLNNIKGVETTTINEVDNGIGLDFTVTTPITIYFFYWR